MKILVISNNEAEQAVLRNLVNAHFNGVKIFFSESEDGCFNRLIGGETFDFFILDVEIKSIDPTKFAQKIFDFVGNKYLIFLGSATMLSDRVDSEYFDDHSHLSFVTKPIIPNDFVQILKGVKEKVEARKVQEAIIEVENPDFIPLKLRNFYLHKQVPFDVYVELTSTKYMKAISANQPYTESAIQEFKRRNIKYLYLEKNEHLIFLENSIDQIQNLFQQTKGQTVKGQCQTLVASCLVIHQYLQDVGPSKKSEEFINVIIEKIEELLDSKYLLKEILEMFPLEHSDQAEQSVLKGIVSIWICKSLGWSSKITSQKMGLAAILHDLFIEQEEWSLITYRDHPHLDNEDEETIEEFINHPKRAATLSHQISTISEVDFIIEQHHEQPDGSGFPRGINASKITQLSATFILANNLVSQALQLGMKRSSIAVILKGMKGFYDKGSFKDPLKKLLTEFKL